MNFSRKHLKARLEKQRRKPWYELKEAYKSIAWFERHRIGKKRWITEGHQKRCKRFAEGHYAGEKNDDV